MVERFFCRSAAARERERESQSQSQSQSHTIITLLSGPHSCGKTSLLFQYALNAAADADGGYVVFICNRRRFESNPPSQVSHSHSHSQGIHPSSSHLFHCIHFKYVDDDEGIKKYFAAFHLLQTYPVAVIIDDFADMFHERNCQQRYNSSRGRDIAMVGVLALSQNAILHANKTAHCKLLLSDTHHGDTPRLLFIYKRWVSSIFTIQGLTSGSFLLKKSYSEKGYDYDDDDGTMKTTAKYSVAPQYLLLEGFTEEDGCIT